MAEINAVILNIQRFSLHDGPGVRTTVFFKGCQLRCYWCANPESQDSGLQLSYDENRCMRCFNCLHACPVDCISFSPDSGRLEFDLGSCSNCHDCVGACSNRALTLFGERMTVGQVMVEVLKDAAFYKNSGGGVTLSGGEVCANGDFAASLLDRLGSERIHRAIETSAYADPAVFHELVERSELLLFDLKHYDENRHIEGTGVGMGVIRENLEQANAVGLEVIVRIPVIPGFNDSLADAAGFADLLDTTGNHRIELLPFHQYGESKYRLLNRPYQLAGQKTLHREDIESYREVFVNRGFSVRIIE